MSVRNRLTMIVVAVALAPLLLSGVLGMQVHQLAFEGKLRELHASRAALGAAKAQAFVDRAVEDLRLMVSQTIRWGELSDRERDGALGLVYEQDADVAIATLLDEHGAGIGEAVFRHADSDRYPSHPTASIEGLSAFATRIPFAAAQHADSAFGSVFFDAKDPILPLALHTTGPHGASWTVAVGLSLRALCARLKTDGDAQTLLVDGNGEVVCGEPVAGTELLTAESPLSNGWKVLSQQPRSSAFAVSRALRRQTMWLILASLVVALALGISLARRITRPLFALTHGASELARGHFGHRSQSHGSHGSPRDEFSQLGAAFDHMAAELEKRESEIVQWNVALQERVDERTAELRETQAQLLQSQKIAAVTSLGAGIAHEINNPLTSVLGFAQILHARSLRENRTEDAQVLELVEGEAQRIKRIVQTLLTFSQGYAGEQFSELDVNQLCDLTALEVGSSVVRELDIAVPHVLGNPVQLKEAVTQLLKNAVAAAATKGDGHVILRTVAVDGVVKIEVVDDGPGIAPEHLPKIFDPFFTTKSQWRSEGLGLTIVHRIAEQHHGRVSAVSELGHGSTFTLTLPSGSRRSHLS